VRVARFYSASDIRVEDAPVPEPGCGQALVRTRACGICTGDIMGWYLERKAPLVLGHEPAGDIVALGEGVEGFKVDDRVFVHHHAPCGDCRQCRRGEHVHCKTWRQTGLVPGGMSDYFLVPAENLRGDTLLLPPGVSYAAASLVEPAACVVKSLRRSRVAAGETLLVIGLGVMGQLHVLLAKAAGLRVVAADMVDFRLARALELGADAVIDVRSRTLAEGIVAANDGEKADGVIVGPGSIETMQAGIAACGRAGTVVLFTASQPADVLPLRPYDLYFDEIMIAPSYSCGPEDTRQALSAIVKGIIREEDLITHRFGLERVVEAFQAAARVDEALKTIVEFA